MNTTKVPSIQKNKNGRTKNGKRVSKEIIISGFVKKFYSKHGKMMSKLAYE